MLRTCTACHKEFLSRDDEQLCPECFNRTYVACENCSEIVERDEAVFSRGGEIFCQRCGENM